MSLYSQNTDFSVQTGVSESLANYRKRILNDIEYTVAFDIPNVKSQPIQGKESITFELTSTRHSLQVDFREDQDKLHHLTVNGKPIAILFQNEHIMIEPEHLKAGKNVIDIVFEAGNGALNRNPEYLYALFVPDRARTVFPCFDQPDLKATFNLSLTVPLEWNAISNAAIKDSTVLDRRKTYRFERSDTLSTYLFAFAAGKFNRVIKPVGEMSAEFLYRESDTSKINHSLNAIFDIHSSSLDFFERWTGISYPFKKFGFVAIPDFQFGGMEHPGNIQYKASSLFLDEGATRDQENSRSNLIAHETAHMWFGDLVTMNWFNDVWMKEVFANFMADKSMKDPDQSEGYDLKFLVDHFPAAYAVDRTAGSNPIRQQLGNLKEAGTMYGNIIYHKAPIMMRQLERLIGEEVFKKGVREYLRQFSNGNASWPDLITILDKYADADLEKWNDVWVNETGRPVVDYKLELKSGEISKMRIRQRAEYGKNRIWPQYFELALYYPDGVREVSVSLDSDEVEVPEVVGMDEPLFVLFNSSGQGYGLWPLDPNMFRKLYSVERSLHRTTAYISLYENMLNGRSIAPMELLKLLMDGIEKEKEELNLKLMCGYISNIYWQFINPDARGALSRRLEKSLWDAIGKQQLSNNKKILLKTYQDIHLSRVASAKLYKIWDTQKSPEGIKLTEDDYTSLAFALALREYPGDEILKRQLERITNNDRKDRFRFLMPAVSEKPEIRDSVFKSFELKTNRAKESNVLSALYYLHHPLRQSTSVNYLNKTLALLEEIQITGDIFFPQNWLQSSFGSYQSKEAADIVTAFLRKHPNYNPKLKAKILQTTDNLYKSVRFLHP